MADGGHPIKPPALRDPTQTLHDLLDRADQLTEVLGLGQHTTPLARTRQSTDQQMRVLAHAPLRWRVGQLQPIPLGFFPGRMVDDRDIPAAGGLTRLAMRAQLVLADSRGQRRVRATEPQLEQLIEQRRRPHMRVIPEPDPAVLDERPDHRRCRPDTLLGLPLAIEVGTDRLTVMAKMPGDRRDRPTSPAQRVCFHIISPAEHHSPRSSRSPLTRRPSRRTGPPPGDTPSRTSHLGKSI